MTPHPDQLHDLHNGYALLSENLNIKNDMLNDFQNKNRSETNITKLVTKFYYKKKYGLNYIYLELALSDRKPNLP